MIVAALARPGGGHSFGDAGGGGGWDDSVWHDAGHGGHGDIGVVLVLVLVLALLVLWGALARGNAVWTSVVSSPRERRVLRFDALARHDVNFSRVLLEDFLHELYVRAHAARGDASAMARLTPYLAPAVRTALLTRARGTVIAVEQLVVASSHVVDLTIDPEHDLARLRVAYQTSFTELYAGDERPRVWIYARETWSLERRLAVTSRAPDRLFAFNCPQCGAPVGTEARDACEACGTSFARGDHEWRCVAIVVDDEETVPPALGGYQPERGTELATIRAPLLDARLDELRAEDPEFDPASFETRVRTIHARMNEAWSELRWQDFRPWCTDRCWHAQLYWIAAYRDQGLRNRMEDAAFHQLVFADAVRDRFFWAITVRIYARAVDITVHEASGRIVGGSTRPRWYSEYWTLIRSVDRRGRASSDETCPNCSAPLSVGMTGACDHCGVKVTGGAYDWVLAKIEQDEAYVGSSP